MSKLSSLVAIVIVIVSCGSLGTLEPTTSSTTASVGAAVTPTTVPVATALSTSPLTPSLTTSTVLPEDETFGAKTVEEWNRIVEAARTDLSDRLGVKLAELETESVETGVWRDGSIGCPEIDSAYSQGLVPGSRIVLRAGDDTYEYHQAGSDDAFLCESPTEDAFKGEEGDVILPPPRYDE